MTETKPEPQEATRRGRPGYDQRGILEVAVEAFNEYGYDATSIGVLAERLGLSKSASYHHVASKDELLRLALDEALDGLDGVLTEESAATGPVYSGSSRVNSTRPGSPAPEAPEPGRGPPGSPGAGPTTATERAAATAARACSRRVAPR